MFKKASDTLENANIIHNAYQYERNQAESSVQYWKGQVKEQIEQGNTDLTWYEQEVEKAEQLVEMFNKVDAYLMKLVKEAL